MRRGAARLTLLVAVAAMVAACGGGVDEAERRERDDRANPLDAKVEFVTFPSITRLTPNVRVEGPPASADLRLEAARGEREAGQLVAWAAEGEPRVVLEAEPLRGPGGATIPAAAVRLFIEQAMRVEHGSPAGRSGTYTDPLVPAAKRDVVLGADQRLLAWIDVAVPLRAAAGTYEGGVRIHRANEDGDILRSDEGVLARVPLRLRVRDADIPHEPTLASHVGFDASQMVRFEEVEADTAELRDVTERYAAELADARLSIGDVGALPPGALPGHSGLQGDAAYLERVFSRRGVASVRIPFYLDYPFADPLGADRPRAVAYLRAAARWARSKGWGDRMYVFAIDEPDRSRVEEVRELHELVRDADPALPLHVTIEYGAREFRGFVDIWGPNINPDRFDPADVARARAAGQTTWWYPSVTTWQPYPTLFVDELRPTPRALGWLAWQRGISGFLYWSATHWHEVDDPYREPGTYNETDAVGNGDGVLLYPGGPIGLPGRPVPSVRLLQLRDGIEDHDLLVAAACAASPTQRRALVAAARRVAPAMDRVDPTPGDVAAMRSLAFRLIEAGPGRPCT